MKKMFMILLITTMSIFTSFMSTAKTLDPNNLPYCPSGSVTDRNGKTTCLKVSGDPGVPVYCPFGSIKTDDGRTICLKLNN